MSLCSPLQYSLGLYILLKDWRDLYLIAGDIRMMADKETFSKLWIWSME